MRRLSILFIILIALSSCTTLQKPTTLDQVKSTLNCIPCRQGMNWNQVSRAMGPPDIAPVPEPGPDLSKNTRIYEDKIVIFYLEMREIKEEGKVRFEEVVTGMDICKKK